MEVIIAAVSPRGLQSRTDVMVEERKSDWSDRVRRRRRLVPFLVAGMVWLNFLFFMDYREGIKRGYSDFTIFYTAGTILRQGLGHQLYDRGLQFQVQEGYAGHISFRRGPLPYNHPPFEAPIFVPLSLLPYAWAFAVWDLLNLGMLLGAAVVLRRSVGVLQSIALWKFVSASLSFFPVFVCFFHGQDSILLLLLCALAYRAMKNESTWMAGCWLALASFKFQFTIPMVLLFLIWKQKKLALGFGAVGIILAALSVAIVGLKEFLEYPLFIVRIANTQALGGVPLSLLPNFHGLVMGWPGLFSGMVGTALAAIGSIGIFVFAAVIFAPTIFAAIKGRSSLAANLELQFSLAVVVAGLIAWQTNAHDLSLLVIPLVLLADYCCGERAADAKADFALLYPVWPLLISPLWMVLWLGIGKVNLMAIPLLWWTWRMSREARAGNGEFLPQ